MKLLTLDLSTGRMNAISGIEASSADLLTWASDGGGSIGGPSSNRPSYVNAVNGFQTSNYKYLADRIHLTEALPSSLTEGDFWYNSNKLYYYDGATNQELLTSGGGGIPDPVTKATNDILQYNGSSWEAIGAASGDPIAGPLYFGNDIVFVGASGKDLLWNTDGSGSIGASGATRPDYVYAKTGIYQGSNQVLDASLGSTKVTNDILQWTGAAWDAKGAAVGDPIAGILYTEGITVVGSAKHLLWNTDNASDIGASGATRPRTGYFGTSAVIAGKTAMKADDSTGGDLSGTYPTSLTVAKVQNVAWKSGAPSDRQVPTYDSGTSQWEAQWPGVVNVSENKTFTILPAGSTVATINTALTDYDVVYLEPGAYSIAAGETIAIGSGKALIGLGNSAWSDTGGPVFSAAAAKANNWIQLNNGYLCNVTLYTAYDQTTDIISGNTTNCANVCEKICVETSAERNVAAFVGGFQRIENIRVGRCNGIYLMASTASGNLWGPTVIRNFKFNTCTAYGIYMLATNVEVSNGLIDGDSKKTDYGIIHSGTGAYSNHWINNVYFYNCGEGVHYEYTTNRQWRFTLYGCQADSCTIGFNIRGIQEYSISNCSAINCVQYGFYLYDLYYGNATNCTAINSNGTAGLGYGNFVVSNCYYATLTGLNSYGATNTSNCGLYVVSCQRLTLSAFSSYTDYYGLFVSSSSYCTFSSIEVYDSGQVGIYLSSFTRCSLTCGTVYSSGSDGVYVSGLSDAVISDIVSTSNGGDGFEFAGTLSYSQVANCVAVSNGGYGFNGATATNECSITDCISRTAGGYNGFGSWYSDGCRG